ncbi:hypothetical protein RRG08_024994 [Elysia crispata]|uniref:Uncharacterized protein n=1 Tax=Elysia crispata TaxID=231223 RepID=A0AAE1BEM2_9GAST|nr:hypothetical protein RRG08_024994 [Elysia crispata]
MSGVLHEHTGGDMLSYRGLEWSGLYHVRSVTRTLRQRDADLPRTRVEWVVSYLLRERLEGRELGEDLGYCRRQSEMLPESENLLQPTTERCSRGSHIAIPLSLLQYGIGAIRLSFQSRNILEISSLHRECCDTYLSATVLRSLWLPVEI